MLNKVKNVTILFIVVLCVTACCLYCSTSNDSTAIEEMAPAAETAEEISTIEPIDAVYVSAVTPMFKLTSPSPIITEKALIESPLIFNELEYCVFYNIKSCKEYLVKLQDSIAMIVDAIDSDEYTDLAVEAMHEELNRLNTIIQKIKTDIVKYTVWENEYYYAAKTFEFLKQKGFSDTVACGIIGNMMIETSGGSLALNPTIYNPTRKYYGLCQWSLYYQPEIADKSFEQQLDYLISNIEAEFKTFGFCYKSGFTYQDFIAMTDPVEAAIAFAKVYERCGSGSYTLRAKSAKIAYEYFTSEVE